jgi:hypothetical protein
LEAKTSAKTSAETVAKASAKADAKAGAKSGAARPEGGEEALHALFEARRRASIAAAGEGARDDAAPSPGPKALPEVEAAAGTANLGTYLQSATLQHDKHEGSRRRSSDASISESSSSSSSSESDDDDDVAVPYDTEDDAEPQEEGRALPYDGDLQAAMKAGDRPAIKRILEHRAAERTKD